MTDQPSASSVGIIGMGYVGLPLAVARTIENNVVGTQTGLKSALRHRKKILLASTSEVYGKGRRILPSEEDDVVPKATLERRRSPVIGKPCGRPGDAALQRPSRNPGSLVSLRPKDVPGRHSMIRGTQTGREPLD